MGVYVHQMQVVILDGFHVIDTDLSVQSLDVDQLSIRIDGFELPDLLSIRHATNEHHGHDMGKTTLVMLFSG